MATLLKCKMCGGDISVNAEMTVGTCRYCGSTMTFVCIMRKFKFVGSGSMGDAE